MFNNRNNLKRTMFTTRYVFPLICPNAAVGSIRHYPNQYSIGHFNYNARMGNGKSVHSGENGQYVTAFNQPKIVETPTNNVTNFVFLS